MRIDIETAIGPGDAAVRMALLQSGAIYSASGEEKPGDGDKPAKATEPAEEKPDHFIPAKPVKPGKD